MQRLYIILKYMYSYKPNLKYKNKEYKTPMTNFSKLKLYYNNDDYVKIDMVDLFSEYSVRIGNKISLPYNRLLRLEDTGAKTLKDYFMYYRSQINFALFASTTALGISYLHTTKGDNLIKSIYRFHIYYQMRRILHKLDCIIPGEYGFSKYNNNYNENSYYKLCDDYGVNRNDLFIRGDWYYSNQGNFTDDDMKEITNSVKNNYCRYMLYTSEGLNNLVKISESIRTYTYLMITSQVASKISLDFAQVFKENFENVINRSVNTEEDIQRYQNVLKYSSSKVDYNIAVGAYMCPSDMKISNVNWSNNLNNKSTKIGKVIPIEAKNKVSDKVIDKVIDKVSDKGEVSDKVIDKVIDKVSDKGEVGASKYSDEKISLVLFFSILFGVYINF